MFSNVKTEKRRTFHHLPNTNHTQQQQENSSVDVIVPYHIRVDEMKAETKPPKLVRIYSASSAQPVDYALKETSPFLLHHRR
ncbi:unnamed protein product [Camellia sinensis]